MKRPLYVCTVKVQHAVTTLILLLVGDTTVGKLVMQIKIGSLKSMGYYAALHTTKCVFRETDGSWLSRGSCGAIRGNYPVHVAVTGSIRSTILGNFRSTRYCHSPFHLRNSPYYFMTCLLKPQDSFGRFVKTFLDKVDHTIRKHH